MDDVNAEIVRAAELFEKGSLADAAAIFKQLCEREDIPHGVRAVCAHNLAMTYDKMGHPDHALATFEYGVSLTVINYVFAQENRANYLFQRKRFDEAIGIWEHLLALDFLAEDRAAGIRHNLEQARA
jgi:tetratricopeptide (TPR) repeat protein